MSARASLTLSLPGNEETYVFDDLMKRVFSNTSTGKEKDIVFGEIN